MIQFFPKLDYRFHVLSKSLKEGSKRDYEIHKGDRYVTRNNIEYISMQEALDKYSNDSKNIK